MTERTAFLREQTLKSLNKTGRRSMPDWSTADEPCSLLERKALALKKIFDEMPVYIGEQELIRVDYEKYLLEMYYKYGKN